MVVNRKPTHSVSRVKFISYDGAWPNLCRGVLTLEIDGTIVKFGHHCNIMHWDEKSQKYVFTDEDPENPNYDSFWSSGGSTWFSDNYSESHIESGEWEIDVDSLPEKYWDLADELDEVINSDVPYGCCGGCL